MSYLYDSPLQVSVTWLGPHSLCPCQALLNAASFQYSHIGEEWLYICMKEVGKVVNLTVLIRRLSSTVCPRPH